MTMWVKISTAGTSVVCSACIAVAATLPAIDTAADHLAKSTSAGVQLSALANLGNLASLSAVPAYANFLQTGKVDALTPLASLSAVPAYADFLQTGDVHKLAPLASLSAVPAYADFLQTGDVHKLAPLASLSAVPAYADLVTGNSATKVAALRSLRSLSAIPEYLGAPIPTAAAPSVASSPPAEQTPTPSTGSGPLKSSVSSVTSGAPQASVLPGSKPAAVTTAVIDPGADQQPAPTPKSETKSTANSAGETTNNPSYSKKFEPKPIILLGGGGSGGNNGIRGWGQVVNAVESAIGVGRSQQSSAQGAGAASSGGATSSAP